MMSAFPQNPDQAGDFVSAALAHGASSPSVRWPIIDAAAFHGLAGDVVRTIEPHTEADPVAILVQYLTAVGNAIGRGPYYQVEGDRHGPNLFVVLVGETAKGRKGTSWGRVREIMECVDPKWECDRVHSGLSTGEGVIWAVRDPIRQMVKQAKGANAQLVEETVDPGVSDKRLMIVEPVFAGALIVMRREGNILSRVIRDAWDRGALATLTKHSPARATGAHVSIIGHITVDELRQSLDETSMSNGYANRFLFTCVRRSRVLPFGGALDRTEVISLATRTQAAINSARGVTNITMTPEARDAWASVYSFLSEGQPGLLGAILARAEAQTIRLAELYALLDGLAVIDSIHLQAGVAVWEYADASARYIWGDALGDPVADEILRALRQRGEAGLTRTEIRDLFKRHRSGNQIGRALDLLAGLGRVSRIEPSETGGRPAETWVANLGG
jgi:hypothetical protein